MKSMSGMSYRCAARMNMSMYMRMVMSSSLLLRVYSRPFSICGGRQQWSMCTSRCSAALCPCMEMPATLFTRQALLLGHRLAPQGNEQHAAVPLLAAIVAVLRTSALRGCCLSHAHQRREGIADLQLEARPWIGHRGGTRAAASGSRSCAPTAHLVAPSMKRPTGAATTTWHLPLHPSLLAPAPPQKPPTWGISACSPHHVQLTPCLQVKCARTCSSPISRASLVHDLCSSLDLRAAPVRTPRDNPHLASISGAHAHA